MHPAPPPDPAHNLLVYNNFDEDLYTDIHAIVFPRATSPASSMVSLFDSDEDEPALPIMLDFPSTGKPYARSVENRRSCCFDDEAPHSPASSSTLYGSPADQGLRRTLSLPALATRPYSLELLSPHTTKSLPHLPDLDFDHYAMPPLTPPPTHRPSLRQYVVPLVHRCSSLQPDADPECRDDSDSDSDSDDYGAVISPALCLSALLRPVATMPGRLPVALSHELTWWMQNEAMYPCTASTLNAIRRIL